MHLFLSFEPRCEFCKLQHCLIRTSEAFVSLPSVLTYFKSLLYRTTNLNEKPGDSLFW